MDGVRKSMWGAVWPSLTLVLFLMMFRDSPPPPSKSELVKILKMLFIMSLASAAISQWVNYLKRYVDYAVEEKLKAQGEKAEG